MRPRWHWRITICILINLDAVQVIFWPYPKSLFYFSFGWTLTRFSRGWILYLKHFPFFSLFPIPSHVATPPWPSHKLSLSSLCPCKGKHTYTTNTHTAEREREKNDSRPKLSRVPMTDLKGLPVHHWREFVLPLCVSLFPCKKKTWRLETEPNRL